MKISSKALVFTLAGALALYTSSCNRAGKSSTTGWKYNDAKWGGFEKHKFKEQETGPGLVFIEGGTFTMGGAEQDLTFDHNNYKRRISVSSFYMDETEVTNFHYLEYLHWLLRQYGDNPIIHKKALPDTLVWRDKLSYNEPYVLYYLRHPAYRDYPVVGVSWVQAAEYCKWRTDRVNEMIMVREGLINLDIQKQTGDQNFNTEAYLLGLYTPSVKKELRDYAPGGKTRGVRMEDGILLPSYRLPTEAEWEYAAGGFKSASFNENIDAKRIYPWNGLTLRRGDTEKTRGKMYANYTRGRGDGAGIAGNLNDAALYTHKVKDNKFLPNDFGLFHMSGNVSEWTNDVYRPLSLEDMTGFNPYRGNVYKKYKTDADGFISEKDSLGRLIYIDVTEEDNAQRRNYKRSDNIGFKDELQYTDIEQKYDYGASSLVDNAARVYKGGSWADRAYWLSPGTRRYLDQEQSTATVGFRCVMDRVGEMTKKGK
ncbi:MAG: SUMF1/EgtB/PvdO family nonheme iron enzyme [Bacteroidia bacterium]